eukprot:528264_1
MKIDLDCNCWDYIRWIFVIWTVFVPMICLILNWVYHLSIIWMIVTFLFGLLFLAISHCILSRVGKYKSTYEMVEEEIEFGDGEKEQALRGYTLCDGCDVELSASDDIFEKNCKHQHIICSDCYDLWMDGFVKLDFNLTQDWRKQIEHILCPICDQVITDHGKFNLNKISRQIDNLRNNKHPNSVHVTQSNTTSYKFNPLMDTRHGSDTSSKSAHMIIKTVDISTSSPHTNIHLGLAQAEQHRMVMDNSNSDTSHSHFEVIHTQDLLGDID